MPVFENVQYLIAESIGSDVAKDMSAVRISPDMQMCVAATLTYLAGKTAPATLQASAANACLALKINPSDGLSMKWEFVE